MLALVTACPTLDLWLSRCYKGCAELLGVGMAFCSQCGAALGESAKFCPNCGASAEGAASAAKEGSPASRPTEPLVARSSSQNRSPGSSGWRRILAYVIVAVAAIGAAFAYGTKGVPARPASDLKKAQESVAEAADQNSDRRDRAAERFAAYQQCRTRTRPLIQALNELDSRLDVGLSFSEYGTQVGNLSVAYARLRPGALDMECLDVAVDLETSYRKYAQAQNVWNDCITDFGCSVDSIEPRLQDYWLDAGTALARGKRELNELL